MSTKLKWGVFLDALWYALFMLGLLAFVFGVLMDESNWASASIWCALGAGSMKWVFGYIRMRIKIAEQSKE